MKRKFEVSRDNLIISGYEYRTRQGRLPAIILSHGYLANQSMCTAYAKLAARLGYVAFTFDFNGGGLLSKSSGRSVNMTVMTEVRDLRAVIRYVRERPVPAWNRRPSTSFFGSCRRWITRSSTEKTSNKGGCVINSRYTGKLKRYVE